MSQEIVYLQKEFGGMPAGTPLVKTERPTEAVWAAAMVGNPKEPDAWYLVQGTEVLVRIPMFKMLVDVHHPTAKEVVGPFVAHRVIFGLDKLADDVSAYISLDKETCDYPEIIIRVCVNTVQNRGQVIRDELDIMPPVLSIDGEVLSRRILRERVGVMFTKEIISERVTRMLAGITLNEQLKPNWTVHLSSGSVRK